MKVLINFIGTYNNPKALSQQFVERETVTEIKRDRQIVDSVQ